MIGKTRPASIVILQPARGVLNQRLTSPQFTHVREAPSVQLTPWVEHYWYVSWNLSDQPAQQQETLPHPNVHLVVERGQVHVWGPRRSRFSKTLSGNSWAFGIKFRPAAFQPFLGGPVSRLANRSLPASEVFGAAVDRLAEQIECPGMASLCEQSEALLSPCLPQPDERVELLNDLIAQIASDNRLTTVAQLSELSRVSERQLQRLFAHYVGVSPKWVIARYRLHEALTLLQSGEARPGTDLALKLGYFDQAHFIRDFTRMVGLAPAKYVQTYTALLRNADAG
ncbi:helix-turn-helix domain-containing protein [Pseudomonas helvetica]|uniref:AraC family transcriptional regulator n=1 Tax=Pseudomonas helvetica TaxID=3136738 RepID=UPI0032675C09